MKPQIFTLFAALTLSAGALFASDTAVDGIYYDFNAANLTATVTYRGGSYNSYTGEYTGDVVIPATVTYDGNTYSVTSIGEFAFYGCSGLTSVTIPNSVTSIGRYAFYNCSGLTSVTIGNSVTSIGELAFYKCSGLTSVTIGNSVTSIGHQAFDYCSGLTSVVWNVKNCADFSSSSAAPFSGIKSQITSFTFGSEVEHIPAYLCYGMENLTSVSIPNSVTSISSSAFNGCSGLTSVVWNAKNYADFSSSSGAPFYNIASKITSFTFGSEVKHIPAYLCSYMKNLTSITIPNSVTSIGKYAFRGCSGLTSVVWNAKNCADFAKYYDEYDKKDYYGPFYNHIASKITSFTFGSEVEHIPAYLCYGMWNLTSVTIPNSVTSIGESAFWRCSGLTSVVWNAKNCADFSRSDYAPFYDIALHLTSFTFGSEVEHIPVLLCYGMKNLTSITIPNSVTSIGHQAFDYCSGLTSVVWNAKNFADFSSSSAAPFYDIKSQITSFTFGSEVKHIPAYLCYGMENLTSVTIPNSVTSIGSSAFSGCSGLTSVTIPNSVTIIGSSAFSGCSGLTSVTIPNSVTSIGVNAFLGCTELRALTLSNSCKTIGSGAFSNCKRLIEINSPAERVPDIEETTFAGVSTTAMVRVPCGSIELYKASNYWNVFSNISGADRFNYSFKSNNETNGTVVIVKEPTCTDWTATIHAYPYQGYEFLGWSDGVQENPRTILVNGDIALTALFSGNNAQIDAVANNNAYGSVCGGGIYPVDETITLTATPNDGYYFVQWSDGNKDNPREVTVNQDSTFTAEFALQQFTVSTDAENGTVTGAGTYAYGTKATLTATPNDGYHFVQWSDGKKDNPREITVTDNAAYTAEFAVCQSVEKLLQITIEKGESYIFAGKTLTAAGTYVDSLHTATGCDSVVTLVLNVHVTPQYTLKVQSENTGKGLVSGGGKYTAGTVIKVMADANEGFEFARWSDNNTENPRWITVTQNQILKAYFDTLCSVEAQVVVGSTVNANAGTVVGTGYFHCGDEVQLQATANTGYAFYRWYNAELGINNTNNPVTLQVPNGTVVTAVFKKSKKTVTTTRSASAMVSVQGRMVYVQNDEPVDVRIYDIIGRTICVANHIVDYMVELKHGAYIVCINDERVKIVIP